MSQNNKITLLYLEDDEKDLKKIKQKLSQHNINIVWIKNPYEALEYLKNNKVDAILVDLELKDEKGYFYKLQGEDFVKKINELFPDMPIFILSKYLGKSISYLGCYAKGDIINRDADKLLIQQIEEKISKGINNTEEEVDFYPSKQWKRKWESEWKKLKKSPNFHNIIRKIQKEAEKDIELLEKKGLNQSYRAYRTTKTLFDVLVSRRVLAYSYTKFYREPGIVWWKLEEFLNMEESAIKNFFFEVGLAWGSIINGKTLLREEREWLQKIIKKKLE